MDFFATKTFNHYIELQNPFFGAEASWIKQESKRKSSNEYAELSTEYRNGIRTRRNATIVEAIDIFKLLHAVQFEKGSVTRRVRFALLEMCHRREVCGAEWKLCYPELRKLTGLRHSDDTIEDAIGNVRTGVSDHDASRILESEGIRTEKKVWIPRRIIRYLARTATRSETGVLLCIYLRSMWGRFNRSRCSYKFIRRMTGLCYQSIANAMHRLREKGIITKAPDRMWARKKYGQAYCLVKDLAVFTPPTSVFETPKRKRKKVSYKQLPFGEVVHSFNPHPFNRSDLECYLKRHPRYIYLEQCSEARTARIVPTVMPKGPHSPPKPIPQQQQPKESKKEKEERMIRARRNLLQQQATEVMRVKDSAPEQRGREFKPLEGDALADRKRFLEAQVRALLQQEQSDRHRKDREKNQLGV